MSRLAAGGQASVRRTTSRPHPSSVVVVFVFVQIEWPIEWILFRECCSCSRRRPCPFSYLCPCYYYRYSVSRQWACQGASFRPAPEILALLALGKLAKRLRQRLRRRSVERQKLSRRGPRPPMLRAHEQQKSKGASKLNETSGLSARRPCVVQVNELTDGRTNKSGGTGA